jgi:hypothetical protein
VRGAGSDQASAAQLAGACLTAAALVGLAATFGRRRLPAPTGARVPPPAGVLGLAFAAAAAYALVPPSWAGVALGVAILVASGVVLTRWSRSAAWDRRRVAAVAGGAVVVRALVGFASVHETSPRPPGGLAQNVVLLVLSVVLVLATLRGPRGRDEVSAPARG